MNAGADPFGPPGGRPADGEPAASEAAIRAHGGRPIWLTTSDGLRLRAARFPALVGDDREAAPVLFLNGRADFIEKNLEGLAELRRRGHAVWTLDWRGQGRSARLLADPLRGHALDFGIFVEDLERFVDHFIRPEIGERRLLLFAHSMGGNIGLRFLRGRQSLFERAVLVAPMIGLRTRVPSRTLLRVLPWAACRVLGRAEQYALGQDPAGPQARGFEGNRLTSCPIRFQRTLNWLNHDPSLWVGGTTWSWVRAALATTAITAEVAFAERIEVPILVIAAGAERIVDNRAMARLVERLPKGRLAIIPDARHELLLESDGLRQTVWREIDDFLGRAGQPRTPSRDASLELAAS
ncbi:alpha/beta fold hydrolase [Thiocystis violacea]|uniref:alpha/beta fold hydrolase n=1 Tax=Thiocystis violacea TaxID=13725 RepID=UPI0019041064|nr:alpha/beta hydrolase [Thiocystis violacea]MBK1720261.1 hypothetical protein [Thiocystis violacea]